MKIDNLFYVMLFIGLPLVFILGNTLRRLYHSDRTRVDKLEIQLEELQEQGIVVVTGSSVTGRSVMGREITKVIGPIVGYSSVSVDTSGKFQLAEREAMLDLTKKAIEEGANAVIDLRIMMGSPEQAGAQEKNPKITYMGTAVVV